MSLDSSAEVCPVSWLNSSGWKVTYHHLSFLLSSLSSSFSSLPFCPFIFLLFLFQSISFVHFVCSALPCPIFVFRLFSPAYTFFLPLLVFLFLLLLLHIDEFNYFVTLYLIITFLPSQDLLFLQELNDEFAALSTDFKKNPSIWKNW